MLWGTIGGTSRPATTGSHERRPVCMRETERLTSRRRVQIWLIGARAQPLCPGAPVGSSDSRWTLPWRVRGWENVWTTTTGGFSGQ